MDTVQFDKMYLCPHLGTFSQVIYLIMKFRAIFKTFSLIFSGTTKNARRTNRNTKNDSHIHALRHPGHRSSSSSLWSSSPGSFSKTTLLPLGMC